jgi:threonine aldolase
MHPIDLRSDTVTRPTAAMRAAMAAAEVGDDVYGEDPTVNRLEAVIAERLATEAAVFSSSGTQSNLMALLAHCGRGDEYLAGQHFHIYHDEGGGAAALGGIQPQPLAEEMDGTLDLAAVEAAVKADDIHLARSRLLCLENTWQGRALDRCYLAEATALARRLGLATHLDGARLFNAAVHQAVDASEIAAHFDSVSLCLSKGLGAPAGSLLCGPRDLIREARRWRKTLGGGMRQAGILAAAGLYALEHHVERLAEDHANARRLASGLARIDGLAVEYTDDQTNMVFVTIDRFHTAALEAHLRDRGIVIKAAPRTRLVTHLDADAIDRVIEGFASYFDERRAAAAVV